MSWNMIMKKHISLVACAGILLSWLVVTSSANASGPGDAPAVERTRINPGGIGKNSRRMYVHLNKATIVDMPVDARDVLVANPGIVDAVVRTPRQTYLLGKEIGQTNVFFFDEAGKQLLNLEVCVERDLNPLKSMLKKFIPDAHIDVQSIKDNIVLSGTVASSLQADRARDLAARFVDDPEHVLNMIAIDGGDQVMLKVKIVEMQRNVAKQLGVDLTSRFNIGETVFNVLTNNPFSLVGNPLSNSRYSAGYSNEGGTDNVTGVLQALERNGMVHTLAEPNLTAISGEAANFLAGGEFPVPVGRDREGNIIIEFKPFGVGLAFTPVVLGAGRVSLKISTEVSELSTKDALASGGGVIVVDGNPVIIPGTTIPSLTVRRAETTVELPSGGSMVIAGLLHESTKENLDGIPGIKDMPILGALARSRDFQNDQTELVIIVTPYMVGPVNEKELATPLDKYAPASDADTVLLGRLHAVYGNKNLPATKKLQGPVGFIVK